MMYRRAIVSAGIALYVAAIHTDSAIALEPSRNQEQPGARALTHDAPAQGVSLSPGQLRDDMTPMQLEAVLLSCVGAKKMDSALFAFSHSGAFGYDDGLRAADPSARQAYRINGCTRWAP